MKKLLIVLCLINTSCSTDPVKNKISTNAIKKQSNILKQDKDCQFEMIFKSHIDDIKEARISKVAQVFTFPIVDGNIWHIVYNDTDIENYDLKKPFTVESLQQNFNKLFSKDLVKKLFDLDVDQLFSKGEFWTKASSYIDEGVQVEYKLKSIYDKNLKKVTLSLWYDYFEDGEKYETGIDFNYEFVDCKLKLSNVFIAN